ncbi:uncharacterized protein LOC110846202 isoform X1 [Folsomia candida]|uniref:uncharacterized protein LOC110846202 isoform X1 n=1 Tax=Folsomia candida TaxID=158441 RepID=UPI000B900687|nr:uncharacterized protein LOC110846202 isoform X1 [Folsomia candida]XP_035706362.1 uncharacterized protein LOC110846202 isoform X1 [Folsomia candida]
MRSFHRDHFFVKGWPYSYALIFYVLSLHVLDTNTRSSSPHWKLENNGNDLVPKPVGTGSAGADLNGTTVASLSLRGLLSTREEDDLVFQILASTVVNSGGWMKNGQEVYCPSCPMGQHHRLQDDDGSLYVTSVDDGTHEPLECGKPESVITYYDQLMGIANRHNHPHIPEPQVAMHFKKKGSKKDTIDLNALERKLRKAKKEKPSSVQLQNQIGNFNRIKGHTLRAIECFRRALAVAPNNPEVLLNLARLLFTLQYLDDSLFLARRSLELQAPDRNAWAQHFALGEILRAYGHHREALLHFKHTLELRPDHTEAQEQLRELEILLAGTGLHTVTLIIIILLVLGVVLVMVSSLENDEAADSNQNRASRHFSRALAMRSLKLGISPRSLRGGKRGT